MTPELRKEASELQLHKRGVRINLQLPVIESDEEVQLRSLDEVVERMSALWLVAEIVQYAQAVQSVQIADIPTLLDQHGWQSVLSAREFALLNSSSVSQLPLDFLHSSQEALYFLGWCAGLVPHIQISARRSDLEQLRTFFCVNGLLLQNEQSTNPQILRNSLSLSPSALSQHLRQRMKLRNKAEVMDWCDLLYRLHWAVRHAQLTNKIHPPQVDVIQVQAWHHAVNWICRYEEVDDWDQVSTET